MLRAQAGGEKEPWLTAEQIPVKGCYTAADLEGMEHLNYAAGVAPFLRGPYSTMYVMRPWTIRQYAGFSTAEESNAFYRRNLASGPEGSFGGLRPGYAPRLRRRPPARGGRRGQGRRVDLLGGGHEGALQRHSARQDVGVDDHERRRAAHSGLLHRGGSGAGLYARPAGRYDPERHPQGVHGA